jgi:hypothetical protein
MSPEQASEEEEADRGVPTMKPAARRNAARVIMADPEGRTAV